MRPLVMIPGPIEIDDAVVRALGRPPKSHLDPELIERFGRALERVRQVFQAPKGQPFIVAGSGTLAMEMAVANLIEPGDRAVVADIGYFGARMAEILERHGATVTRVTATLGSAPSVAEVAGAMAGCKVLAITHVDTSTAVRNDVRALAALGRENGALVVVDGVCSVGGEELLQDAWDVDVVLTASQKAIGAPPGLAIVVASQRALAAWRARKCKVASYYADFASWLPIMEAYEARKPKYFATPAVNLVEALDESLRVLLEDGVPQRIERHRRTANAFRAAWKALELTQLPTRVEHAAHTLSAVYYPSGIDAALLGAVRKEGVVIAGGLHPEIGGKYFRVGHMGACPAADVLNAVGAIERALAGLGYKPHGVGRAVAAAQAALFA
ncbi:MAG TPA: alanine--glyoxylate aminotransferase family protein [Polyangiaceae bacterium]|nr:alanine--glyoxylate aminotransferase family protein [Polyangiaceae bacterium]